MLEQKFNTKAACLPPEVDNTSADSRNGCTFWVHGMTHTGLDLEKNGSKYRLKKQLSCFFHEVNHTQRPRKGGRYVCLVPLQSPDQMHSVNSPSKKGHAKFPPSHGKRNKHLYSDKFRTGFLKHEQDGNGSCMIRDHFVTPRFYHVGYFPICTSHAPIHTQVFPKMRAHTQKSLLAHISTGQNSHLDNMGLSHHLKADKASRI